MFAPAPEIEDKENRQRHGVEQQVCIGGTHSVRSVRALAGLIERNDFTRGDFKTSIKSIGSNVRVKYLHVMV
jgi:hypothetical protein